MVCWISYDAFISWGDGNWQQSCPKRDFPSCRFFFASGTPWVCGHWKACIRNGLHKLFIAWACMGLSQDFASKFQYQTKGMMILSYIFLREYPIRSSMLQTLVQRKKSPWSTSKKRQHLDVKSSEVHAILLMLPSRNSCCCIYIYIYPPLMDV